MLCMCTLISSNGGGSSTPSFHWLPSVKSTAGEVFCFSREVPHAGVWLVGVLYGLKVASPDTDVGEGFFRPVSDGCLQPLGFHATSEALRLQCSRLPPHCPKWFRP
jgi:hypothetical protein